MKKLLRYYHQARKIPFHIFIYKAIKKIAVSIDIQAKALKSKFSSAYISDRQFLRALDARFDNINAFLSHIVKRKQPIFFFDAKEKTKIIEIVNQQFPEAIKQTVVEADKVCEHVFNLLGSGDVYLGEKIDWHVDFKTGIRWKLKYYEKINYYLKLCNPSDVKVPWELSHCQHFVTLGKAYWYTRDEKYVKDFVEQINDWIDSNPPKFGGKQTPYYTVSWAKPSVKLLQAARSIIGKGLRKPRLMR